MVTNSKEYARAYYHANKEKFKEARLRWLDKQKALKSTANLHDGERFKQVVREEFREVPTPTLTYSQMYYAANKEAIKAKQKQKRISDKRKAYQKEYYAEHRERIAEQQRTYYLKRQKEKKMSKNFFGRIVLSIKKFVKGK